MQSLSICRPRPTLPTTHRARPRALQPARAVVVADLIEEIDIVEYASPQQQKTRLGRVIKVQDGGSKVVIEPLVEEDEEVFVQSEEAYETVPGLNIACTVDYELSQRQDKESNPHGEHAHDTYRILALNPAVWRGNKPAQKQG